MVAGLTQLQLPKSLIWCLTRPLRSRKSCMCELEADLSHPNPPKVSVEVSEGEGNEAAQTTGLALGALQVLGLGLSKLPGLPATAVAHSSEELLFTPFYCYLNLLKGSFSVCFLNSHSEGLLSALEFGVLVDPPLLDISNHCVVYKFYVFPFWPCLVKTLRHSG